MAFPHLHKLRVQLHISGNFDYVVGVKTSRNTIGRTSDISLEALLNYLNKKPTIFGSVSLFAPYYPSGQFTGSNSSQPKSMFFMIKIFRRYSIEFSCYMLSLRLSIIPKILKYIHFPK